LFLYVDVDINNSLQTDAKIEEKLAEVEKLEIKQLEAENGSDNKEGKKKKNKKKNSIPKEKDTVNLLFFDELVENKSG
jgi:hypothetical protein